MSSAEKFLSMARAALGGAAHPAPSAAHVPPAPRAGGAAHAQGGHEVRPQSVTARPSAAPAPRVLASYPDDLAVLDGRPISRGAARLWSLLHDLAVTVGKHRGYEVVPRQVTYHLPAVTLCGPLGVTDRHLRRLALELEAAGLLDCGGHAQRVGVRSMFDGTLWAVLMLPGGEPPRIRADEWRHEWRPDFRFDVEGKTGAASEMSELLRAGADEVEILDHVKRKAANPGVSAPPLSSSDISRPASLRAVVEGLSRLWHLHPSKRVRAVGLLASQIAAALVEPDRRRYWCRVIWEALKGEQESRGSLQVLGAQLSRLDADLREGAPWRNPGAVLAARLKAA
jgi:hypothetical protein